jgi:hypothetical protein
MRKKIEKHELLKIHNFLRSAIYEFKEMNIRSNELLITLPNWLKHILRSYPMQIAVSSYLEPVQLYEINKYFDIEVQPHYKDEVVVFFKDYHVNPENLKPMIYEIKTQEE